MNGNSSPVHTNNTHKGNFSPNLLNYSTQKVHLGAKYWTRRDRYAFKPLHRICLAINLLRIIWYCYNTHFPLTSAHVYLRLVQNGLKELMLCFKMITEFISNWILSLFHLATKKESFLCMSKQQWTNFFNSAPRNRKTRGGGVLPYVCILGMCRTRDPHFQP